MPALNFQARFAPLVERGIKRQTIRAYRRDGRNPAPGSTLYLYTGMRTKNCRLLAEHVCKAARRLEFNSMGALAIDGVGVAGQGLEREAIRDGFRDFDEMQQWFREHYGFPFQGLLIQW